MDWKFKKLDSDILLPQFDCRINDQSIVKWKEGGGLVHFEFAQLMLSFELFITRTATPPQCNIIALINAVKLVPSINY